MPSRSSKPKMPRDPNQLAKRIVDLASGSAKETRDDGKNPHAVALGRLGGQRGGKARAESLTSAQRRAIAEKAASARWGNKKKR